MELRGKKVVVVGLGASGVAVCRFCAAHGAHVLGVDDQPTEKFSAEIKRELENAGLTLHLGGKPETAINAADLVVVSPGIPPDPILDAAESAGVPLISEVELAARFLKAPLVGITGTNGKSTVTALIGEMLERSGRPTFVGGNLGTPMIEAVGSPAASAAGAMVVELSSFQLERIERLRPTVAVLLNITEDHLDRYPTMAAYVAAKARIFFAQKESDAAVVNGDDPLCLSLARAGRGKVHLFGRGSGEVHETAQSLVDEVTGVEYPISQFKLTGAHNRSNACAAIVAARIMGAKPESIREALANFSGLPHRMEHVGEAAGVRFYNDSKATNVGAAVAAIQGLDGRAVLIAGGRDKGGDYSPLREQVRRKVRAVVLIGEAADRLESSLIGAAKLARASTMNEAVERAASFAHPGDAVLLAPACSSFDMFKNFVERGEVFRHAVADFLPRMPNLGHLKKEGEEDSGRSH